MGEVEKPCDMCGKSTECDHYATFDRYMHDRTRVIYRLCYRCWNKTQDFINTRLDQ